MTTFQFAFLIFELIVSILVCWSIASMTMSMWHGAPYVSTTDKAMNAIFRELNLKRGARFLELGCGNGKIVCTAVKDYGAIGRGIEISWLWIIFANIRARMMGVSDKVEFIHQNIRNADLAWANVVFIYMMPRFLGKFQKHLLESLKPGTIVISHSFEIELLKEKATRSFQIDHSKYLSTYFYILPK